VDPFEQNMANKKRKQVRFLLFMPILLALIIGGLIYVFIYHVNGFQLELNLLGEERIVLDYGQTYAEAGAVARFYGSHMIVDGIDVPVKITGSVDENQLGRYEIRYEASYERWHRTAVRTVEVIDREAPRILLAEKTGNYVLPGDQYREEGFMARDNHDGDLTDQVVKTVLADRILYQVQDSSGNRTSVIRQIVYYDPIPPVILLEGDSAITVQEGSSFTDPGYTASDNCDGDITDRVRITGTVDTGRPGTYHVYYTVEDSFGNSDTEFRIVRVKGRPQPKPNQTEVKPSGKVIYLTFDDGPSKYTQRLLEILDQYDVKATFFVVNTSYAHMIDDIVNQGHSIGAHTYSHDYREIYSSEDAYFRDLQKICSVVKKCSGVDTRLLRFPGGSSNTISRFNEGIMSRLTHKVVDQGYKYFDWNVDSNDAGGAKTADEVFENVIGGAQGRRISIVLQHDTKGYSVDAVEQIIVWGLANGYTFLPLDETSPMYHHRPNN